MKKLILFTFGLVLIMAGSNAQSFSKDLQQLRQNYIEALKNSDTEKILQVYSKDAAIHHIDGTMLNGSKEIGDFYNEFFKNSKATIAFENISEDKLAKDLVFYHDKVFLDIQGEDATRNIEVINIAKKINEKWRVIKSYRWPMPE
ncbi:nuclear transport factor 2 family protein [Gramella sp. KN1008]|uniref:nuclear transport factor 2 family protein n=1 Tax=Gramella sp. KN1008 TaxID=2529298 RepID=UPI001038B904|nr:nuclear transport factor 2 family protein [Gramella sp. KN1008]TBW28916.1 nuclear transport factor 2 family protein [Gramella sp. KN1008]